MKSKIAGLRRWCAEDILEEGGCNLNFLGVFKVFYTIIHKNFNFILSVLDGSSDMKEIAVFVS